MAQQRDLDRTREKILAAATAEFAAKGFAGARVDTIARRARVNKQMLYYCFGAKRELYREILRRKFAERTAFLDSMPATIEEALLHIFDNSTNDLDFVRMLEWEALDSSSAAKTVAGEERRALFTKAMEKFGAAQRAGAVAADVDVRHLFISFIACAVFPLAFPQMMRLVTGLDPTDPRFRRSRREFLSWLGRRLGSPSRQADRRPSGNGDRRISHAASPLR
jgi:TetR/AcrR family transcriptional regulator